jgi:PTS system fructose-specific IIC component
MISQYIKKEFCIMNLNSSTKEEAIGEIVLCLVSSGKIKNKKKFTEDILKREKLGSTGIGFKVALPHARTEAAHDFVLAFGRSLSGIDFGSLDGEKASLVFLMGANPNELSLYLRLLAELSQLIMKDSFRQELLSASSSGEVIEIFKKFDLT